jgi:hypothetical protein
VAVTLAAQVHLWEWKGKATMKSLLRFGLSLVAIFAVAMPIGLAQPRRGAGAGMPRYDKSTETTIAGTIQDVQQYQNRRMQGTHLIVKTESETLEVRLGPSDFLAKEGFTFAKGDSIEVLGSKVKFGNTDALIAKEVTKDGKKLTLRDAAGRPLWAARRGTF